MKSIWNGAISFGLVNIPVDLISAEDRNDLSFRLLDSRNNQKVRYERVNEETGEEVPWKDIVKAYEFSDNSYVVVTDEDFEKADVKASKTIDIETFIERAELSLLFLEKPYYIQPKKGGEKAYVLLREALEKTGKVAIARVVIRTRSYMAAIFSEKDVLVLDLIRFAQELKSTEELKIPSKEKISAKEMDLAVSLIESMTEPWDPTLYKDEYREALMKRIREKAKGQGIAEEVQEVEVEPTNVVDIMDLLKQSVKGKKKAK